VIVPFACVSLVCAGYEGGFRKGAEESMRLMRDNRAMLCTVLEVFLVDPLYKWALSPAKVQQLRPGHDDDDAEVELLPAEEARRGDSAGSTAGAGAPAAGGVAPVGGVGLNSGAARAMFSVRQRLAGIMQKDILSVEGQVNALVHEATDVQKWNKMFVGWSAYV
jgi:ataxia telangiectasia mutated family protein